MKDQPKASVQAPIGIKEIYQIDLSTLGITWSDEQHSKFDVRALRLKCPCASCVDEWTKKRLVTPENIAKDVRPERIDSVGRYALKISFSDGHDTGLYTFKYLRELSQIL